jgi:hypothetical protein
MGESKLIGRTVRVAIKAALERRNRPMTSHARFVTRVAGHRSFSTRGERGDTWTTKRWTPCRIKERTETLAMRAKAANAADKATHVERHQ